MGSALGFLGRRCTCRYSVLTGTPAAAARRQPSAFPPSTLALFAAAAAVNGADAKATLRTCTAEKSGTVAADDEKLAPVTASAAAHCLKVVAARRVAAVGGGVQLSARVSSSMATALRACV